MSSQTGVIFHILGNDWKPPKAPSITNNLLNYIIPHISTNTNMQKAITTLIYRGEKVKKKNWLKIYIKSHYIDFFYIYVCICMCISRSRAFVHTQIRIHMWSFFFLYKTRGINAGISRRIFLDKFPISSSCMNLTTEKHSKSRQYWKWIFIWGLFFPNQFVDALMLNGHSLGLLLRVADFLVFFFLDLSLNLL